ncbi:hypothetical protein [Paractinoplanes atraurantiacus]|uniref:Neocarzinostatin family protein n=1 Tax=Paractinoplanes atraurantiacus TaxID=1036182 RepID=A0A285K3C0_9ACTN|nr:hypothetical protein [Actinoplanes atraurantiacus]SNY67064.1 hypothetical protein SAMN05421748_13125 [Actinoplanes atraurantiacus]
MRIGRAAVTVTASVLLATLGVGAPAQAAKHLSVSKTKGLKRAGETVTVSGRGYDVTKGIYVAFCVDNGAGAVPSPCGGGADMSGSSGSSAWISSNPPSYGEGLAKPYGKGGSFTVSINVSQMIGDVDCTVKTCAIVTRNDHTRTSDRSQDVRIPVRFAAPPVANAPAATRAAPAQTAAPAAVPTAAATAGGSKKTPAGPPSVQLATAAPPAATTAVAVDTVDSIALNRTSSATPLGHWWAIGGAFIAGMLGAAVIGRLRRRRPLAAAGGTPVGAAGGVKEEL